MQELLLEAVFGVNVCIFIAFVVNAWLLKKLK
jgi:hypothetical protein